MLRTPETAPHPIQPPDSGLFGWTKEEFDTRLAQSDPPYRP
ncbi:MAG: hypothetical protein ABI659_01875 [Nitrosospira sp.]